MQTLRTFSADRVGGGWDGRDDQSKNVRAVVLCGRMVDECQDSVGECIGTDGQHAL